MTTSKIETTRKAEIYRTNLFWKVKLYLEDNSKNIDDYEIKIVLDEASDGADITEKISEWDDLTGLSKPGSAQLDPFDSAAEVEKEAYIIGTLKKDIGYPSIGDQLDLLYKDMTAGKLDTTGEWHKTIKAAKDTTWKNPDPSKDWEPSL